MLAKTLLFIYLDFKVLFLQYYPVRIIRTLAKYPSCQVLNIGFLGVRDGLVHDLFHFRNRHRMVFSLHYINTAIQCENSHFIQFIAIFFRVCLAKGYQFIIDEYRKFQFGCKLLLEIRICSQDTL